MILLSEFAHSAGHGVIGQVMSAAVFAAGKTVRLERPHVRLPISVARLVVGR